MAYLRFMGISAAGGLAILVAGLLISSQQRLGWEWVFGVAILMFVWAGAVALLMRAGRPNRKKGKWRTRRSKPL